MTLKTSQPIIVFRFKNVNGILELSNDLETVRKEMNGSDLYMEAILSSTRTVHLLTSNIDDRLFHLVQ